MSEIEDLGKHVEYQDMPHIIKSFEVKDHETKMENGVLNAIYAKLALKGL